MPGEPKTIGRYEVQRELGHGAMGVVYLAFDPLLKRPLAIKTVREFGADAESTPWSGSSGRRRSRPG